MNEVITWDTPEHHHTPKTSDWYWSLGIIAVAAAILCILLSNILFALFILIAAFVAGQHAGREPKLIHIELHDKGILLEKHWYPFKHLDSFWIEEDHQSIILKSKKIFVPYIIIPFTHIPADEIHAYLSTHLKEVEHHESFIHHILEYFGL